MGGVLEADFFAADAGVKPAALLRPIVYAPGDEPNPKNPGGISNNELKRRADAEKAKASVAAAAALKKKIADADAKKAAADQKAALDAAIKRSGGIVGDLTAIGKGVATGVGDLAKVAGAVATVIPGGQVVGAALLAGGAALGKLGQGDVKGALVAGASAAAPALGSAVKATSTVAGVVKTAGDVVGAVKSVVPVAQVTAAIDQLAKGANINAASLVPSMASVGALVYDGGNLDGMRVVADKLLAAQQLGGALGTQAQNVINATTALAYSGSASKLVADAKASLSILSEVGAARAKEKIAAGAERAVSAAAAKAAAQYIGSALGIKPALAAGGTARADLDSSSLIAVNRATSLVPKASPAPLAPAPAKAPTPAPIVAAAPVALPPAIGFVVTPDAQILDGTRWVESAAGVAGTLVLATGPIALRREETLRYWTSV